MLLVFSLWQHHCFKTNWLLVWPFAEWKIKLSWAIAGAFDLMRERWTHSSGWVGWRRIIEHNHSGSPPPVNLQTSSQSTEFSSWNQASRSFVCQKSQTISIRRGSCWQSHIDIFVAWESLGKADLSISLGKGKSFLCFILWWHVNISGIQEQYSHRKELFLLSPRLQTYFWGGFKDKRKNLSKL